MTHNYKPGQAVLVRGIISVDDDRDSHPRSISVDFDAHGYKANKDGSTFVYVHPDRIEPVATPAPSDDQNIFSEVRRLTEIRIRAATTQEPWATFTSEDMQFVLRLIDQRDRAFKELLRVKAKAAEERSREALRELAMKWHKVAYEKELTYRARGWDSFFRAQAIYKACADELEALADALAEGAVSFDEWYTKHSSQVLGGSSTMRSACEIWARTVVKQFEKALENDKKNLSIAGCPYTELDVLESVLKKALSELIGKVRELVHSGQSDASEGHGEPLQERP